jgi:hypothetical protein
MSDAISHNREINELDEALSRGPHYTVEYFTQSEHLKDSFKLNTSEVDGVVQRASHEVLFWRVDSESSSRFGLAICTRTRNEQGSNLEP